ncbi:MAG TPA: hypothetical protein VFX49_17535 [Chloroflexota bacterium]|nr:hypothetical protein [Chloroflexota bacterium]
MRRVSVGEVIADLRRAVDLLGAPTVRAAAAARRHGLLGVARVPA